ncbi:MAG TPA: diguanylate cyclase, partial [Nitrospirota bacterium]|nr:diguanylate cyclase [Nitrospirota bacterium]
VETRGEMKARALEMGASDYMEKPFDPVELAARINLVLRRREVGDELQKKNRELAEINRELRMYSIMDELTKTYSRPYFFENMTAEMKRCARYMIPLSLMLVDLDNFEDITGVLGREAGDQVLRDVAEILRHSVRDSDAVGRYGDGEFIVNLVHTDGHGALVPAERIRESIAHLELPSGGRQVRTTASIGVAEFRLKSPQSREEFLRLADQALREAKTTGRNKVVIHSC